jgi:hypothetical protein
LLFGEFTNNAYLVGLQSNEGGRAALTFGDPNVAALYFFLSMMIIAATHCPRHRGARVLAYAVLLPSWALSGSNSGIVELLLGITLIVLLGMYRRSGLVPTVAAACFLVIAGALLLPQIPIARLQRSAQESHYRVLRDWVGRSQATAGQREVLLHESVDLYFGGTALGSGPTSTIHRLTTTQAPFAREAHDDYVSALIERGFVGAIGILLLIAGVATRTWSVIRRPLAPAFAEVVPSAAPLAAGVAGIFVFGTVYEMLHVRQVWAFFGLVAALYLWGRE